MTSKLSIVVCTHDRGQLLPELLEWFDRQNAESSLFEIIVIGNGITDGTDKLIKDLIPRKEYTLKYFDEPILGLSTARNTGIEKASNDVICFVDDDFLPEPGWVDGMIEAFNQLHVGVVGGRTDLKFVDCEEPTWLHRWHRRMLGWNDKHVGEIVEGGPSDVFGNNFAFRKHIYFEVGGFSSQYGRVGIERGAGEELDFVKRCMDAGYRVFFQPKAYGWHFVTPDRLDPNYLRDCAFGAGKADVLVRAQSTEFGVKHILEAINEASELSRKEEQLKGLNYRDWVFCYTRRFNRLGQIHAYSSVIFGSSDPVNEKHLQSPHDQLSPDLIDSLVTVARQQVRDNPANFKNLVVQSSLTSQFLDALPDVTVSVVLTLFNDVRFVGKALASILSQSHVNLECIAIDSCSTDGTLEVVRGFAELDKRLKIIELVENKGPSRARNIGIEAARGKYLCFMDGDDLMMQDSIAVRLAAVHHFAFKNIAGAYVGESTIAEFDGSLPTLKKATNANDKVIKDFISCQGACPFGPRSPLVKIDLLRKIGGFNENMSQAEDWEFWYRLMRHGFCFVPTGYVGVAYRQKKGSLIRRGVKEHLNYSSALHSLASSDLLEEQTIPDMPDVYKKSVWYYVEHMLFVKRVLTSIGMADVKDVDEVKELMSVVPRDIWDIVVKRIDTLTLIKNGEARLNGLYGWLPGITDDFLAESTYNKFRLILEARASLVNKTQGFTLPDFDHKVLEGAVAADLPTRGQFAGLPTLYSTVLSNKETDKFRGLNGITGFELGPKGIIYLKKFHSPLQPPFGIDILFSAPGQHALIDKKDWSRSMPPMPFVIGPFSAYDIGGGYFKLDAAISRKPITMAKALLPQTEPFRVTIFVDNDYSVSTYINGHKSGNKVPLKAKNMHESMEFKLGKGFNDRTWSGKIKSFSVYSGQGLNQNQIFGFSPISQNAKELIGLSEDRIVHQKGLFKSDYPKLSSLYLNNLSEKNAIRIQDESNIQKGLCAIDMSQPFVSEITFEASGNHKVQKNFSPAYPPMPARIGPFAVYDFGEGEIMVNVTKDSSPVELVRFIVEKNKPFRLALSVDQDANTSLSINGLNQGEKVKLNKIELKKLKRYVLGSGYLDRHWVGTILNFDIKNIEQKDIQAYMALV